jgi:hypothetical protein
MLSDLTVSTSWQPKTGVAEELLLLALAARQELIAGKNASSVACQIFE